MKDDEKPVTARARNGKKRIGGTVQFSLAPNGRPKKQNTKVLIGRVNYDWCKLLYI
jgi:hypothetical protein